MIRAAFRVPGFKRLFTGLAASMFGDSLMLIVLSLWVKTLTGSNALAGLTFLFMTAPALVAPVLGYLVDRVPGRRFLVLANLGSAVAVLPLLAVRDAGDVWIVYGVAFCYGVSFVVIPAALNGLMKDLLPTDVLVDANSSLSITREALRLVGPLLGAGLFAVAGGGWVAVLDALTFVAAALAVATLRVAESPLDLDDPDGRLRDRMAAGASFLRATPVLLHTTVALGLSLLMIGFSESGIFAVVDAFDRPATFVGTMLSMQGVGAIVGGLLASRLVRRLGEPRTVVLGLVVLGVGLGGVTGAVRLWQLLAAVAVLGAGIPLLLIAFLTLLQRRTPGHLMGRVSTFVEVLTTLPQALSIAVGALLVTLVDYRVVFGVMTAGVLLAAAYPVLVLRDRLRPDGPDDGSATTAGPATPAVAAAGPEAGAPATVLPEPGAAPVPPPVTRAD